MFIKYRVFLLLTLDLVLINLAFYFAFFLRWDGQIPSTAYKSYLSLAPWFSLCRVIIFNTFNLYRWSFRYASLSEAVQIFKAVILGSSFFIAYIFFSGIVQYVGRGVPLIDFLLTLFFIVGFRFFYRLFLFFPVFSNDNQDMKRVLIVGAGASGESVVRELLTSKEKKYIPVGFIDDDISIKKQSIHGVKVLGTKDKIPSVVKKYNVDEIIIAIPSAQGKVIRDIIISCQKLNVRFKIIPGLQKILSGNVELKTFRNVKPEDLIGRESVKINTDEIRGYIENKDILITGASGSIGSELVRQSAEFKPKSIILYDYNENDMFFLEAELKKYYPNLNYHMVIGDIKDVALLKYTFSKLKPQVVLHAAAHKHVPLMEANPVAAVKNNVLGSRNLIYASEHYGVERFVLISTDKAVNPTSIMGATKRITEMLCQAKARSAKTKFMAVRFGNVIGSNGSVIQVFKKQIEEGKPLSVTHPEIRRFFMTVSEAVQLVLQAGAIGQGGEIFILDMGEQIKIVDLAKNLLILSGIEFDKETSIEITGLRPGEKLYEEVLHDSETDTATIHNKIFIAKTESVDLNKLNKDISELQNFARIMRHDDIIRKIQEIVPNFILTPNKRV